MEILLYNVVFEMLTYYYGKTVLSEEHLKTLAYLGNNSGPGYAKNSKLI